MKPTTNPKKTISGFKKFGLSLATILCGFMSVAGIFIIVALFAMPDRPSRANDSKALMQVGAIALTVGAIRLTYYLNRLLTPVADKATLRQGANPFICEVCRSEAPLKYVRIHRHIGMIVAMQHKSFKGRFCKECFSQTFWEYTLATLLLGWWGFFSFFITPFVLVGNLIMFARCVSMSPAVGSHPPTLTESDALLIDPVLNHIVDGLQTGKDAEILSNEIAKMTGVTPAQAYMYLCKIPQAAA